MFTKRNLYSSNLKMIAIKMRKFILTEGVMETLCLEGEITEVEEVIHNKEEEVFVGAEA